ncbi:MAG: DUF2170 family protein [Gammaproteobacteria bacterium]|nr:DUF2170 family protein [Gammaproteobacteria bacterium]MBT4607033.1 DUF2170 family protein [Thiotrichales bacterium]MBT3473718.1 DUF2170 family protein [Gammaproteobacteria bacterium]MBT3968353.1 DUF2170 family protein [Gammaproteobacteria bacterium]MBT4081011.1 DUF2170 family protein [Gammaproteobacteria bacterium]
MIEKLKTIVDALNGATTSDGLQIEAAIIDESELMAQVTVETREEFPIIVDINETQVLAIVNLFESEEIKEGLEAEMMEGMLSMNIPLPLSAFAKTGQQYQLYGAASVDSKPEVLVEEIDMLSCNLDAALEAFSSYLK